MEIGKNVRFRSPKTKILAQQLVPQIVFYHADYCRGRGRQITSSGNFLEYIDKNLNTLKQVINNAFSDHILAWAEGHNARMRAKQMARLKSSIDNIVVRLQYPASLGNEEAIAGMKVALWATKTLTRWKVTLKELRSQDCQRVER